jgi:hypothetical protein
MDSLLLRLRFGIHKDNLPMIAFGVLGMGVMAISFLGGSNVFMTTSARISSSAYIIIMLYFVFVKKHDDTSI